MNNRAAGVYQFARAPPIQPTKTLIHDGGGITTAIKVSIYEYMRESKVYVLSCFFGIGYFFHEFYYELL